MIHLSTKHAAIGSNQLLNGLNDGLRTQFIDLCEVVDLTLGEVVCNLGDTIHHVYFPLEGIISWEKQIIDSPDLMITLIGNEGMLCISSILGVDITPCRAVVQKSGFALRIAAADLTNQLEQNSELNTLLKRYVFVNYDQLVQTAACNLFHLLEYRLAKLILMFQDRSQSNELHITQELLAQMLGVRRVGVTKAAGSLQRQSFISYSRGNIIIHNRQGLKTASCLCYQADKNTYTHFLNAPVSILKNVPDDDEIFT